MMAAELDLILTSRQMPDGERVPMCGIPAHVLEHYTDQLQKRGIDVAVSSFENGVRKTIPLNEPVEELDENDVLNRAKSFINAYCQKEFSQDADFSDLSQIGIAYTTVTDAEYETQVNANLVDYSIDRYVSGVLVDQWKYGSLGEMLDTLEYLDFNELVSYTDDQIALAEKEELPLAPPQPVRKLKESPHILLPEITSEYRTNFRIENDDIGVGTPLERFHHNITAIQLLKKLETEHRLADTTEQRILSDYVGWGGLSEYFREDNSPARRPVKIQRRIPRLLRLSIRSGCFSSCIQLRIFWSSSSVNTSRSGS